MKKLLLSSAIAAAMGVSGVTNAAVDFDATTPTVPVFASEIDLATNGTITNNSAIFDIKSRLGFGVSNSQTRYVRVDLTNANFGAAVLAGNLTVEKNDGNDAAVANSGATVAVNQGGAVDDDFVILQITASADYGVNALVNFATPSLKLSSKSVVTAQYRLFETAVDAVNKTEALYESSNAIVAFGSAIAAETLDVTPDNIDVTQASTYFDDSFEDQQSVIGRLSLDYVGTVRLANGSLVTNLSDLVDGDTNLRLTGDFSTFERVTVNASDSCGDTTSNESAVALTGTALVNAFDGNDLIYNIGAADHVDAVDGALYICATTNGEDIIPETTFAAVYEANSVSGYSVGTLNVGELSTLTKNGSSAETNLQLDPQGAFQNFIRITNPSTIDGRVFLQVINDAGESVSFGLNDLVVNNGVLPENLTAGASTRLIPMTSVIAAAQGADSSFGIVDGTRNKFRIIADGEFGSSDDRTGVRIDNITLATDKTTFSTF